MENHPIIKNQINTPEINIPKGGGLVKGVEESHHVDAFTGNDYSSMFKKISEK